MELAPELPPAPPEQGLLRRGELGEGLARLLACLSPAERLALVLHDVFELEHAEVAKALGTSSVNARQYLARARRRLRQHETGAKGDAAAAKADAGAGAKAHAASAAAGVASASAETPLSEKLCRDRLRRFQAAINGLDLAAMLTLLADEQPMSVVAAPRVPPRLRIRAGACANDAWYRVALAA
jgi:RNA polymerase sigma-70 factor (ECF subfamily)